MNIDFENLPPVPKATALQKRIYRISKNDARFRMCHAMKENGRPCKNTANTGEVFCHAHLRLGYGLFTAAVLAQLGAETGHDEK
jgi:hypothetical protein